jgi:hypothetical protein
VEQVHLTHDGVQVVAAFEHSNQHRPTMVSLFEIFYVFFINFRTLNSKIIPRFIHHVQFF